MLISAVSQSCADEYSPGFNFVLPVHSPLSMSILSSRPSSMSMSSAMSPRIWCKPLRRRPSCPSAWRVQASRRWYSAGIRDLGHRRSSSSWQDPPSFHDLSGWIDSARRRSSRFGARGCCDRPRVATIGRWAGWEDMAGVGGHSRCVCRLRSPRHRAHGVSVPSPSHHHPRSTGRTSASLPSAVLAPGCAFWLSACLVAVTSSRLDCSSSVPRLDGRCREHATVASISRPRLKAVMVVHASRPMEGGRVGRIWLASVGVRGVCVDCAHQIAVLTGCLYLCFISRCLPSSSFLCPPPHRPPSSTHLPQVPYIRPSFPRSSHSRRHSVHVWSFAAISMSRRDVSRAGDLRFHHASTVETATDTTL